MYDFGDFGDGETRAPHIAGPLVGGGATQAAILAVKMLFKTSPKALKYSALIGTLVGAAASGALMFWPKTRKMGLSGLVTAALLGIPRQIEDLLLPTGTMADSLGMISPERSLMGDEDLAGLGTEYLEGPVANEVQLLDAGSGSTGVLGVVSPERSLGDDGGGTGVEVLGSGFGSSFLAAQ